MSTRSILLFASAVAFAGSAVAAPVVPFVPDNVSRVIGTDTQLDTTVGPDEPGLILVQNRGRGGGGGGQRAAGGGGQRAGGGGGAPRSAAGANRGGNFNRNAFH